MPPLDRDIDALYQLPPAEFTGARTALAKSLPAEAARRVRALKKPTAVPWAVNQVYWKARPVFNALMDAGKALRAAQVATLKGRKADVRAAADTHRRALAHAVHEAHTLASTAHLHPNNDQLARMFEAVSLAPTPLEDTGRFTQLIEPSGFEALAGVTPAKRVSMPPQMDRREEQRRARAKEARVKKATRDLELARQRAQAARDALERAQADVEAAKRAVEQARSA